jgi:hypothetical protein
MPEGLCVRWRNRKFDTNVASFNQRHASSGR